MKKPKLHLLTIGLLLLPAVAAAVPQTFTRAVEENAALIIHDDSVGEAEMQQLRSTLVQAYGFSPDRTRVLSGDAATADGIWAALQALIESNRRSFGQVLLYLSLPMHRGESDGAYFVPYGASVESPWELVRLEELAKVLSQLASTSMLMVYPSCGIATRARGDEIEAFNYLTYGEVRALDVLGVCDRESMRLMRDSGTIVPPADRRALTAQVLNDVLGPEGVSGTEYFGVELLVERFNTRGVEQGLSMRHVGLPDYRDQGYVFFPQPSELARYQHDYRRADGYQQAEKLLYRLVAVAAKESQEFVEGVADFLGTVAKSESAGLAAAPAALLSERERLSLRAFALEQLARMGNAKALNLLFTIAQNTSISPSIRGQAISFVEKSGNLSEAQLATIRTLVGDADETVSVAAIRIIGRLRDLEGAPTLMEFVETTDVKRAKVSAIQSLAIVGDPAVQAFLLDRLKGEDDVEVRSALVKSIGELGRSVEVTGKLLAVLDGEDNARVVSAILTALPKVTDESLTDAVIDSIAAEVRRDDEAISVSAMYALGEINREDSVLELRRQLRRRRAPDSVRVAAAESLGQLRRETGVFIAELAGAAEEGTPALRRAAVEAMGLIGNPESIEVLAKRLNDDDAGVRASASDALRRLNTLDPDQLLASLRSPEERVRFEAVTRLSQAEDSEQQMRALVGVLGDDSPRIREVAVRQLGSSSAPNVEQALSSRLRSNNVLERRTVISVLGLRGSDASLEVLLRHKDNNPTVQAELVSALGRYKNDSAVERILESLQSTSVEVRIAAVQALSSHRDSPEVRKTLESLARTDGSKVVQREAERALGPTTRPSASLQRSVNKDY